MLDTILTGISIVVGIVNLRREQQTVTRTTNVDSSLTRVEQRLAALQGEVEAHRSDRDGAEDLLKSYNSLISALRESRAFNQHLEFIPTEYGTYKLVRRLPSKRSLTILRDSRGEY